MDVMAAAVSRDQCWLCCSIFFLESAKKAEKGRAMIYETCATS